MTDAEAKELEQLVRAQTTPQALALRARIVPRARAHPNQSNQQLATAFGTTDRTVHKWRGRWVKTHSLADAPAVEHRGVFPSGARVSHDHSL
ncbi:MAG TPA: helix-turn-helix domain-containing protein [Ktedonobacteraceae bacterium]|nr:helix-turn-helix domain-containing protein [Ktedonobacteraceae bacterium]